ncbi:hypothetical protein JCM9157_2273 [Halalkalibacter akibai JCM 9157]|uniref:Uncharacterized protein n=1 Tax=Halalkalibacter akibai (strain ATCC 43226 / DSM 21942 / CIP 109018 / JCM 9157 / 1139) TaxID=1236973 RepID=W4QSU7_HALA3|nr:hypothetical protein JCM9157_2273 [Halalkalibacter akibai JCM 9157]
MVHNVFFNSAKESLNHQREQLVHHLNLAYEENWDRDVIQASLELALDQEDKVTFIFGQDLELKYKSMQTGIEDIIIEREIVQSALSGEEVTKIIRVQQDRMFIVAAPMVVESDVQPNHVIVSVLHGYDREASQIKIINLIALLITVLFTAIIIFFVSRKITSRFAK